MGKLKEFVLGVDKPSGQRYDIIPLTIQFTLSHVVGLTGPVR